MADVLSYTTVWNKAYGSTFRTVGKLGDHPVGVVMDRLPPRCVERKFLRICSL